MNTEPIYIFFEILSHRFLKVIAEARNRHIKMIGNELQRKFRRHAISFNECKDVILSDAVLEDDWELRMRSQSFTAAFMHDIDHLLDCYPDGGKKRWVNCSKLLVALPETLQSVDNMTMTVFR